jgi:hypothetical protein
MTDAEGVAALMAAAAADSFSAPRATRLTFDPTAAQRRARAKPMPLDPPVINTCRSRTVTGKAA